MTEAPQSTDARAATGPKIPRTALLTAGLALVAFVLVLVAAGAAGPIDDATLALAAAGAALVYALRRMYAMVRALARPDSLAQVGRGVGHFSQSELREEKRRLLRAIKELEFDHGMGKLSTADFEAVIGTYRVRAIEVMRTLDGGGDLHPELQKVLADLDRKRTDESAPAAPGAAAAPTPAPASTDEVSEAPRNLMEISSPDLDRTSRICAKCTGPNDNDARFCKHCGVPLERNTRKSGPTTERRGGSSTAGEIGP
ncbi:zinc ribbon domain-containing protein [Nannocystis punicea]|uniref:Zinc ribbon domain-containing protein n=1 Tax=Nannocystis punicea TaxID=2995304 RepID=A0ABY7GZ69_9BACT|nr:zinc ribbon domain-containing protein [Nannocystis poenicansa]WAS92223.1 zinc ribbon domain-containing protein [Nannocystis poenicansa]